MDFCCFKVILGFSWECIEVVFCAENAAVFLLFPDFNFTNGCCWRRLIFLQNKGISFMCYCFT